MCVCVCLCVFVCVFVFVGVFLFSPALCPARLAGISAFMVCVLHPKSVSVY